MDKLKYAIIGCGIVAKKHLKGARYHQNQRGTIQVVAAVDTRPGAAVQMLKSAGFSDREIASIKLFADDREMLAAVKPDLVAITTPSGSHAAISLRAIEAGAHVLIEKPLTLSLPEAQMILKRANELDRRVAVGHIYRFFPLVQAIQADIAAGLYGRVLYGDVKVRWGHDQAYYDQAAWRGTWHQDGGALMNQSVHALDLMSWLLGQKAKSVTGKIFRQQHHMEAEDLGLAILEMENDVQCLVEGTTNTDSRRPEASFFVRLTAGEIRGGILSGKPSIQVFNREGQNVALKYTKQLLWMTLKTAGLKGFLQLKNPHSGLLGDLIAAIREKRSPLASGQTGQDALELVLAIYQSALENRTIDLPVTDFELTRMNHFFD
ncbi:MAG: Gfo/Idh/MocA family oxidoreductase [Eubacteriales bacterium]|nr:Gfo/Idh/MocA family oxidoreductase [Eubacteriales bacterium]